MADLFTGPSRIAGTGCFAARPFKKGELVGEYTGPRISEEEADRLHGEEEATYLFMLDDGTVIDATHDPSPVKYINHSCSPNCEALEEGLRIFIYALRDIDEGEELSYDYRLVTEEDDEQPCACGSPDCRGTMKGED